MDYWLKAFGAGARGHQLRDDWKKERGGLLLETATFPKMPRMRPGDAIVYYGAGYGVAFAAGKIASIPWHESSDDSRWPFRVRVDLSLALEFIHDGVPLDEISVDGRNLRASIRQHSHIRLKEREYEAAIQDLRERVERYAS